MLIIFIMLYIPSLVVKLLSHVWLWPHGLQHARPPCPSPAPGVYPNSCPLSRWCHPAISSSVVPFSSCLQSFPASGSFLMSRLFTSGGLSIGASASASVLPMNVQDWCSLGWTGLILLLPKRLSRVYSSNIVQKHQFFGPQPCLWSNSTSIHDCWKNRSFACMDLCPLYVLSTYLNTWSRFLLSQYYYLKGSFRSYWEGTKVVVSCSSRFACPSLFYCYYILFYLFPFWPCCPACRVLGPKPVRPALEVQSLSRWTTRDVLFTSCFKLDAEQWLRRSRSAVFDVSVWI